MGLTAVLFPGQGAYRPGLADEVRRASPAADAVLRQVSDASEGESDRLFGDAAGQSLGELVVSSPELSQWGIFATSLSLWAAHHGSVPDDAVLLGHSFGEITALTCAGGYSVADGAKLVRARNRALAELGSRRGGMMALGLDVGRAEAVLRLVDDPTLAVASVNAPLRCVVSGSVRAIGEVADVARKLGVACTRLAAPYAFHGPLMSRVARACRAEIGRIPQLPLVRRVFSPYLGRFVCDHDDFGALIVDQFVARVNLVAAFHALARKGVDTFVECGAGAVTAEAARSSVAGATAVSWDRPDPPAEATPVPDPPRADVDRSPGDVLASLRTLYSEVLGYPPELFEPEADLEADLGVDSLKQTDLLTRVAERFGMDTRASLRVTDFPTLEAVADAVRRQLDGAKVTS